MDEIKEINISPAEWRIMRIVWTLDETTVQQIVEIMTRKTNWSPSTIKTLVARLVKKDFLKKDESVRPMKISAKILELDTMEEQALSLFNNFCAHRSGEVLQNVVQNISLSKDDIAKLELSLADKAKTAPNQVKCNCI